MLLERRDNPEKRRLMKKWGGAVATFLLLYDSITFTLCVGEKVKFALLYFDSSVF